MEPAVVKHAQDVGVRPISIHRGFFFSTEEIYFRVGQISETDERLLAFSRQVLLPRYLLIVSWGLSGKVEV